MLTLALLGVIAVLLVFIAVRSGASGPRPSPVYVVARDACREVPPQPWPPLARRRARGPATPRDHVLLAIRAHAHALLVGDRGEDESLPEGTIEELLTTQALTIPEMADWFEAALRSELREDDDEPQAPSSRSENDKER